MHIVLLNQAFHPDVVATAQMAKDLADHLARRGHRVSAIASRSIYGKSGAVLPKREEVPVLGGSAPISVYRVGFSLFGKRGTLARLFDFAFFYVLAAFKILTIPRADVVVGFSTPPFIALLALLSRTLRGGKAVYWAMDLYPDVPIASGMLKERSLIARVLERIHRGLIRRADATVALGRCMRDRMLAKGLPGERIRFIPVWSDESGVTPLAAGAENPVRSRWGLGDEFVVMYSGNFGLGHDAETIKAAMLALRDEPGVRFVFVGGGKRRAEIEAFIREHGLKGAAYHDYVPREELSRSLAVGDAHLISLREGMEGLIVPSKLFGIMAAGRAGLFIGNPSSEIARILTENQCGEVVREGDAGALVAAIRRLAADRAACADMGARARAALLGRYDATTACAQWVALLEELTGTGPAARG
ncbi:MAG: glycosyltransferase family 4 protein [Phycisphaeraceae bacterium]|nr:glycosyltransferase family 4 protein [Phycisphaeraceae bacterium]